MVQGKQLRARITSGSNFKPESLSRRPCFKGSFLAGCSACPCPSPVPTSHQHGLGSTGRSGMRSQGEGRHGRRQTHHESQIGLGFYVRQELAQGEERALHQQRVPQPEHPAQPPAGRGRRDSSPSLLPGHQLLSCSTRGSKPTPCPN